MSIECKRCKDKNFLIECGDKCGRIITAVVLQPCGKTYRRKYIVGHPHRKSDLGCGKSKQHGYILIYKPEYHGASPNGYVKEHRLLYEKHFDCCLLPWTEIHHKNGIRDDNRIENLELHTKASHTKIEIKKRWINGIMNNVNFNHKRDPQTGKFIKVAT